MSRAISEFDSEVGPSGQSFYEWTAEQIAALWDKAHETVESVAGSSTQYVGTISDLDDHPHDKLYSFIPHVECGAAPALAINGEAFRPIKFPNGSAVSATYLKANRTYLLLDNGTNYILVGGDSLISEVVDLQTRMATAETDINNAEAAATALTTRVTAAEAVNTSQAASITGLLAADVSLDGRLDTLEPLVANLGTRKMITSRIATTTATETDPAGWDANNGAWVQQGALSTTRRTLGSPVDGRLVLLENSTDPFLLQHTNAGVTTAANSFDLGNHLLMMPRDMVWLAYDGATSRWKRTAQFLTRAHQRRHAIQPGTGTTPDGLGLAPTATGLTHPAPTAGAYFESLRRMRLATSAVAGTSARLLGDQLSFTQGSVAGAGGFLAHFIYKFTALPSTAFTFFAGMLSITTDPGNVNANTLLDCLGHGANPADANIQRMSNDGSGLCSKTDLGTDYPINTTAVYESWMGCIPNASRYFTSLWRLDDLTKAPLFSYITTNMPANTVFMTPTLWLNNRAGAADYQMDIQLIEVFTPNWS